MTGLHGGFTRQDIPEIAAQFARVTFLTDVRSEVPRLRTPTLILQCNDDLIAPISGGEYLHGALPHSTLGVVENVGHCPHLSAPSASTHAINAFLDQEGL